MARCLIFALLFVLVIVGQSLSSPAGDISDGSSSGSVDTTAAKSVQLDATGKTSGVALKLMDADVGKKDEKPESESVGKESAAKPSEREKARTHLSNLGLLEIIKNKLPTLLSVHPYGYQQYGQQSVPIIPNSPVHNIQPIAFPQTLVSHVQQPFVTGSHISPPVVEHAVSKPSYSISQQVIHKPLITELQEVVRKPVFAELQEVIHKPILTEVQQVIKRPIYTEHIIKHPTFNSLHQEVVERPLHLQTQQYHLVTKPFSQIVQLPTQHLVQHQPIVQPVISSPAISSPISGQLNGGLSSFGFFSPSPGPISFPSGFAKPLPGFSTSPFSGFVGSSVPPASPPVISSVPFPAVSSVPSPVVSPVSSPVIPEFAYPSYSLSSQYSGHSPGEIQFLTPYTCRSSSCGPRAVDSGEIPMNFGGAEFTGNMQQSGILYDSVAMPQANFVQANENLVIPYYTQPQSQQVYFQPMLPTTGEVNKGGNDNAVDPSINTENSASRARLASSDSDDNNSYEKGYTVLTDSADLNSNSQKQYPFMNLEQFYKYISEEMKRRSNALEEENSELERMLQKLRKNPEAIRAIEEIVNKAVN